MQLVVNLLFDFLLEDARANQNRFAASSQAVGRDDRDIVEPLPVVFRIRIHEGADVDLVEPAGGEQPLGVGSDAPDEDGLAVAGGAVDELANAVVDGAGLLDVLAQSPLGPGLSGAPS